MQSDNKTNKREPTGTVLKSLFLILIRYLHIGHTMPANGYLFKFNNRNTRKKMVNMFKVNSKNNRTRSPTSFWCLLSTYC